MKCLIVVIKTPSCFGGGMDSCDISMWCGQLGVTLCDREGERVKVLEKKCDIISEWPLSTSLLFLKTWRY